MRLFQITSSNFSGQINLLYNDAGLICNIEFEDCTLPPGHLQKFLVVVSCVVHVDALPAQMKQYPTLVIVEKNYEVTFDMFWKRYNKKINKKRTEPLWDNLSKSDQVKAYIGIPAYDKYLAQEKWRPKADPEKYLRDRYFENEYK